MKLKRCFLPGVIYLLIVTALLAGGCSTPTPSQSQAPIASPTVTTSNTISISPGEDVFEILINGTKLMADFSDNAAANELKAKLSQKDLTITMSEFGRFEKVGELGFSLPASDESITAKSGDIVLYQGDKLSMIYGENTWQYTRLGKIRNIDEKSLRNIFGEGDVTVTLSLPR